MDQEVLTADKAMIEINKWLEFKDVDAEDRVMYQANLKRMANAMVSGRLSLNADTMVFTQKLKFPLTDAKDKSKVILAEISFQPRCAGGDLKRASQNVKSTDFDGKVLAYIAALTGESPGYIDKLDSEDLKVGQSIAVFFM
jgi:hypothetical protein